MAAILPNHTRIPLGVTPECNLCKTTFSVMWGKNEEGKYVCNSCTIRPPNTYRRGTCHFNLRKSTRAKSAKRNVKNQPPQKGNSRHSLTKKTPTDPIDVRCPSIRAVEQYTHEGQYYQKGDIVSMEGKDKRLYFAQIHGLAIGLDGHKCAYITYLVPTQDSKGMYFDPRTYILGKQDSRPRKLEYLKFVCHAPDNFYDQKTRAYRDYLPDPDNGFFSTLFPGTLCTRKLSQK